MRLFPIFPLMVSLLFGQSSDFLDRVRNAILCGKGELRDTVYQFSPDGLRVSLNTHPTLQLQFIGMYNLCGVYQASDENLENVFISFRIEDLEVFVSSDDRLTGNFDKKNKSSADLVSSTEGLPFEWQNLTGEL